MIVLMLIVSVFTILLEQMLQTIVLHSLHVVNMYVSVIITPIHTFLYVFKEVVCWY